MGQHKIIFEDLYELGSPRISEIPGNRFQKIRNHSISIDILGPRTTISDIPIDSLRHRSGTANAVHQAASETLSVKVLFNPCRTKNNAKEEPLERKGSLKPSSQTRKCKSEIRPCSPKRLEQSHEIGTVFLSRRQGVIVYSPREVIGNPRFPSSSFRISIVFCWCSWISLDLHWFIQISMVFH